MMKKFLLIIAVALVSLTASAKFFLSGRAALSGLNGLGYGQRKEWFSANEDKVRGMSMGEIEKLYRNQQYVAKYGFEDFKSKNSYEREQKFRRDCIEEEIWYRYRPYKNRRGDVDLNKGTGNALTFIQILCMDTQSKEALLDSGWRTQPQINKIYDSWWEIYKRDRLRVFNKRDKKSFIGSLKYAFFANPLRNYIASMYIEMTDRDANAGVYDRKYQESLYKKERLLKPFVNKAYNEISTWSDEDVKKEFMKAITPTDNNMGNGLLKAYFVDGKNAVKYYSIDDMRMYLAKSITYANTLDELTAQDILTNGAQSYIAGHLGFGDKIAVLVRDITNASHLLFWSGKL